MSRQKILWPPMLYNDNCINLPPINHHLLVVLILDASRSACHSEFDHYMACTSDVRSVAERAAFSRMGVSFAAGQRGQALEQPEEQALLCRVDLGWLAGEVLLYLELMHPRAMRNNDMTFGCTVLASLSIVDAANKLNTPSWKTSEPLDADPWD
ncbi:hypothetical protein BKA70DRAFT_1444277 [Coprinopsis sp. MPI-PUGE-AT-0042]|nr:hypothetical protein BKA70DRAFT_1444277 [Coprinopsis sp. MPI-PUGE-AT-0042]